MKAQKAATEVFFNHLWLPLRTFLLQHRALRRLLLVMLGVLVFGRLLLLVGMALRQSPEQLARSLRSDMTEQSQAEIQRTHEVTGKILDSLARDPLMSFHSEFSSREAANGFLRKFASIWVSTMGGFDQDQRAVLDRDISFAIYDPAGRLRIWSATEVTSPAFDTLFTSGSILDRRARLAEIDSDVHILYYSSFRRLFSSQGAPIGYVGFRRTLATRQLGDSVLVGAWFWKANTPTAGPVHGMRFIAGASTYRPGSVYVDSNDHSTKFGHFDLPGKYETSLSIAPVWNALRDILSIIETVFLLLSMMLLLRALHEAKPRSLTNTVLTWEIVTVGLLLWRLTDGLIGGIGDFWATRLIPTSGAIKGGLFSLASSQIDLIISGVFYCFSAYLAFSLVRSSITDTDQQRPRITTILPLAASFFLPLLVALIIHSGSEQLLQRWDASLLNRSASEHVGEIESMLYAILSVGSIFFILAGHLFAIRLLKHTKLLPQVQRTLFIVLAVSQAALLLAFGSSIANSALSRTVWITIIAISGTYALWERSATIGSVLSAVHPTLRFIVVCTVGALIGVLEQGETQSSRHTDEVARVLPSPTQVIVEYIASTSDSTTRNASIYNTRSFDFWRGYLSKNPDIGANFELRDPATGRVLDHVITPDVPVGSSSGRELPLSRSFDGPFRATELIDSSGGRSLTRLLGGTGSKLQYSLSLERTQGPGILPIARLGTILWGRDPHQLIQNERSISFGHSLMRLVLLFSIIVFGGFLILVGFRLFSSNALRITLSLQERILIIGALLVGTSSIVIYGTANESLSGSMAGASLEVFNRNVAQVRRELGSSNSDSLSILERHMTTAAEQLNCDVALFDEADNLIASSMTDCFRYNLLPAAFPAQMFPAQSENDRDQPTGIQRRITLGNAAVRMYLGTVHLPMRDRPVHVVVARREESYHALRGSVAADLFDALGLGSLCLIGLASILSVRLTRPLRQLQQASEAIADGSTLVVLPEIRTDEFGDLVNSFKRMTEELSERREHVAQTEREGAWREMARQVAHEIKNPLTPMKLSIQHVQHAFEHQDSNFPNIFRRVLKTLAEQIDVLTRIATEFARFGEMPRRRYAFVALSQVVDSAVALFEADRSRIRFAVNIPDSLSKIYADEEEFRRALVNLVKNAVQAITGWGIILITAEERSGLIYLKISDSGVGMKPETVSKAFDPNFSTKTSGMGLGLAIVRKTITDMSGTIRVDSELGKGTTFYIELPARDPNATQE